jgi:MFS family permease
MIKKHLHVIKEKASFSTLFAHKMSFIMFIALGIAFFQQITGINAIFYYAPTIFEKTGGGQEAAFMQAIIIGLVNLGFTFVAMWLIDKLGRKPLLLIGTSIMAISLFVNAGAFHAAYYQLDQKALLSIKEEVSTDVYEKLMTVEDNIYQSKADYLTEMKNVIGEQATQQNSKLVENSAFKINSLLVLFAIIGYIAAFAISLGPVMWALLSEIFPNQIRGLAISVVGFFNSLVSFTVTLVFPWQLSNIGPALTFLVYGIFAALAFIFVIRYIPETKKRSLEELESILLRS